MMCVVYGRDTNIQEVEINDKSLFDKVRLIDELSDTEKNMVIQIIDLALSKKKFKELAQRIF